MIIKTLTLILTFLSHKDVKVTVNVKDIYIEDVTLIVVNITEIVIQSHPDLTENNKRALIVPTEFPQVGISKKARFHLLTSVDLPIDTVTSTGAFSEKELVQIANRGSNMVIRSSVTLQDVDLYREEEDYNKDVIFLLGIYLQNRTASFSNMMINVTGTMWYTQDPFNIYIRNIEFDAYSLKHIFFISVECNYPEAYKTPFVDIDGLKYTASKDRTTHNEPMGFGCNLPANWTARNVDAQDYYSFFSFCFHLTNIYFIQSHISLQRDRYRNNKRRILN